MRSRLSNYLNLYLKPTGLLATYNIDRPSIRATDPNYIINNVAGSNNITLIGIDTFNISLGGTYFVPSTDLSTVSKLANSLILRAACVQNYCPDFLFQSIFTNLCLQKSLTNLCEQYSSLDHSKIYGLNFTVSNYGQIGMLTDTFTLTLPTNYILLHLYMVGNSIEFGPKATFSSNQWTNGTLSNIPIEGIFWISRSRPEFRLQL